MEETQVQETPVVETPAPAAPAKPESLQDTVAKAVEKSAKRVENATAQPRDNGKFAGPPQFPKPSPSASTSAVTPAGNQSPAAPQRPEMPKSLKLELKPHWDAAPAELAAAIHQRELDYEKGREPLISAKAQYDELLNEFKPYEMLMRMENATPKQAIGPLLQTAAILRTGSPVQKAQAVAQTMQQFGISLEHVQQLLQNGVGATAPPTYTNGAPAVDSYAQLFREVEQLKVAQEQQSDLYVKTTLQQFQENPAHQHYATVKPMMGVIMSQPEAFGLDFNDKTEQQMLEAAYEKAIWANPDIRKQLLAEQAIQQQAIPDPAAQARHSAVQVSGAPRAAPASKVNVRDLHAVVEDAIRRNQR